MKTPTLWPTGLVVQFKDSFCLHSGCEICFSNCSYISERLIRRVGTVVFRDTNSRPVSLLGNNEYKSLRVFHVLCLQSSCSTCI